MKGLPFRDRLGFAWQGIRSAWHAEASFRVQLAVAASVLPVLVVLRAPAGWWAVILLTIASVLAAELMNTALERVLDHLHPGDHEAIRIAKDCAAGGVLVLSVTSVVVFICFLIDRLG